MAAVLLYSQEQLRTEDEREEEFVFLKERATHVGVEAVGEVVGEVPQTTLQELGLVAATTTFEDIYRDCTERHTTEPVLSGTTARGW